jgi:drug/metabolite transporter (DMT)-like permease
VTALFSVALGHEEVPRRVWLGVVATFTGIGLVVYSGARSANGTTRDTLLGAILLFGATLSWAAYTVGSRSLVQRYGSLSVTAWMLWAGTIGIIAIGLPDLIALDITRVQANTWLAVLYAGALSVGLAYLIWHYGVKQLGNTRTSVYSNLVPVMALTAAWLTRGEVPTVGQIAGATVIIGGVTIAQLR